MMPWIRLRDHRDFYNEIMRCHWHGGHDVTKFWQDPAQFRDIMLEHYGIDVTSGPVGPDRRFYLDDRNYLLFLLKWS